jgi:hypothetical protein
VLTKYPLVANNHSQHKDILYPQVTSCTVPHWLYSVVVNMCAQLRLPFERSECSGFVVCCSQ